MLGPEDPVAAGPGPGTRVWQRELGVGAGQYTVRVLVFGALWWSGWVVALGVARVVLSWPLVAATLAVSAVVLRKSLPEGHPGLRHPQT